MGGTPVQYMRQANYLESSEVENVKKKVTEISSNIKK